MLRRALADGHRVHALVRRSQVSRLEDWGALKKHGATVFEGHVGDPRAIEQAARGCDVAIHAAAVASHRAPSRVLGWVNVAGTSNVARAVKRAGCQRMIHLSCTDVTLCNQKRVNWNEDRDLIGEPLDAHAHSKRQAEEIVVGLGTTEFQTVVLRPATVWGPGDLRGLPELCAEGLAGGVYVPGRGDNLVAATYIENLVDAVFMAIGAPDAGGAIYHIVDNELTLAGEYYRELSDALGLPSPRIGGAYSIAYARAWLRHRRGRPGLWPTDIVRRGRSASFDQQRAIRELGYSSAHRRAEGLEALGAWARELGGPEGIFARRRLLPKDSEVEEQIRLADQDSAGGA